MSRTPQPAEADVHEHDHAVPTLLLIESLASGSVHEVLAGSHGMLQRRARVCRCADGVDRPRQRTSAARYCIDLSLPECRDLSAIDELRRVAPGAAIMILARAADQALARRAVERGANDFVVTDQIDTRSLCAADRDDVRAPRPRAAEVRRARARRDHAELDRRRGDDHRHPGPRHLSQCRSRSADRLDARRGLRAAAGRGVRRHRRPDRPARAGPVAAGDRAQPQGPPEGQLHPGRPRRQRDRDRAFGGADSRSPRQHRSAR